MFDTVIFFGEASPPPYTTHCLCPSSFFLPWCIVPSITQFHDPVHPKKSVPIRNLILPRCSRHHSTILEGPFHRNINTLRPRQNGRQFPDDILKWIFLNENDWISIEISLKFVPKGQINNIPALVQMMAWRRIGDKPLSEPMLIRSTDAYMWH